MKTTNNKQQTTNNKQQTTNNKLRNLKLIFLLFIYLTSSFLVNGQITIYTSKVWDINNLPPSGYSNGITISGRGTILTINGLTLSMNVNSSIKIVHGSTLNINNSIITAGGTPATKWDGIRTIDPCVEPHDQYYKIPDPTILNDNSSWEGEVLDPAGIGQGGSSNSNAGARCNLENSRIEYAIIGVLVDCDFVLRARTTTFYNNETGCSFRGQEFTGPDEEYNASYIMDCDFIWDLSNTNTFFDKTKFKGIDITKVRGLRIGGCKFKNESTEQFCLNERGIGINCIDASFFLSQSGSYFCNDNSSYNCTNNCQTNPRRNLFENLNIGIKTLDTDRNRFKPYIAQLFQNSDFKNNFIGIENNAFRFKLIDCSFNSDRSTLNSLFSSGFCTNNTYSSNSLIQDLITINCESFEIYNNTFEFTGMNNHNITINGNPNFTTCNIQKNTFKNNFIQTTATNNVTGIKINSINSQLKIKCNEFINLGTDIEVGGTNTIKQTQGSSSLGAGNIFSNQLTGRFRLNNSSGTIIDYYLTLPTNINDPYNPETLGFLPGAMGLNLLNSINPEGTNCQIKCSDFISSINGIENSQFLIYPNPSSDYINIKHSLPIGNLKYSIFDNLGKLIKTDEINEEFTSISLKEIKNGLYFIFINYNNNMHSMKKFVIMKD